jgi:predicted RNA binding protein YcfA (HicA-like mRNA interferase family)
MPKLPVLSGYDLVKALARIGFLLDHQTGSHLILRSKHAPHRRLTIPNHKVLAKGTLMAIMHQAGLTKQELVSLVNT